MLIGAIILATYDGPNDTLKDYDLGAAFALVIVAAIFAIAGGVLMFISSTDE